MNARPSLPRPIRDLKIPRGQFRRASVGCHSRQCPCFYGFELGRGLVNHHTRKRGTVSSGPMNFAPSLHARGETLLVLSAGTPDPTREQMAAHTSEAPTAPHSPSPHALRLPLGSLGVLYP